MRRVLVTVRCEDEVDGRDLELPADVPATDLAPQIHRALGWSTQHLFARLEPGGRRVKTDQSLREAGATDGAWLVFSAEPPPEPEPPPPPTRTPHNESFPTFVPLKTHGELLSSTPTLLGLGAALVLIAAIVLVMLRPGTTAAPPQPASAPTLVPTSLPTPQPTLAPTVVPTPVPTAAPTLAPTVVPTAVPTVVPTPAPIVVSRIVPIVLSTAVPTLAPTLAPTPIPAPPDAASLWPQTAARLDAVWERDWPQVIQLTQAFLAQFPNYGPATDKLYVALLEYGRSLRQQGRLDAAQAAFEGAAEVQPQRVEARAELDALRPQPAPVPPPAAPTAVPLQPRPTLVGPAPAPPPPPAAEPEPAPPPTKQNVTRDGYDP